jgi:hypothetical protein
LVVELRKIASEPGEWELTLEVWEDLTMPEGEEWLSDQLQLRFQRPNQRYQPADQQASFWADQWEEEDQEDLIAVTEHQRWLKPKRNRIRNRGRKTGESRRTGIRGATVLPVIILTPAPIARLE